MKLLLLPLLSPLLFLSCDPGHYGNASIENNTGDTLILDYKTRYSDTTITIFPNQKTHVLKFGGLGEGSMYPGALNEFNDISLTPTDTNRSLIKDITIYENWEMINNNEKRFSSKEIECWFTIGEEDIVND